MRIGVKKAFLQWVEHSSVCGFGGGSCLELNEPRGVFHPVTAIRSDWKVKQKPDFKLLCGLLEHERY